MKKIKFVTRAIILVAAFMMVFGFAFQAQAQSGELLFAYLRPSATENRIVSFNSTSPGTFISNVLVTGLQPNEFLLSIDLRPANGRLYAVGSTNRIYEIAADGTATAVNATPFTANPPLDPEFEVFGLDFNPTVDRLRLVSTDTANLRLNPTDTSGTTTATQDADLEYVADDPNEGEFLQVNHIAYSNNFANATTTTLYGIDFELDNLVRIGGVDGNPSPNGGLVTTIGPLGVVTASAFGGFDISGTTGVAYAVLRVGTSTTAPTRGLYTINLSTGAATFVGFVGNGTTIVDGLAVANTPTASGVTISGTVLRPKQRGTSLQIGIRKAEVSMTDMNGQIRKVRTDNNGNFTFEEVESGQTYIFNVTARGYKFASQVITVTENFERLDFTGQKHLKE